MIMGNLNIPIVIFLNRKSNLISGKNYTFTPIDDKWIEENVLSKLQEGKFKIIRLTY